VNGTEDPSLCISGVEIEFVSGMNSMVFILGGKVILESVKLNNQTERWVSPLVFVDSNTSNVVVNLHSCTITNCIYKNANSSSPKSAVVYFIPENTTTYTVILNISFCFCYNNTFNLSNISSDTGGGFCLFCSYSTLSSMFFFFFFFFGGNKINQ
jgi:hypothetical protein